VYFVRLAEEGNPAANLLHNREADKPADGKIPDNRRGIPLMKALITEPNWPFPDLAVVKIVLQRQGTILHVDSVRVTVRDHAMSEYPNEI
jgi:hypothetical protein